MITYAPALISGEAWCQCGVGFTDEGFGCRPIDAAIGNGYPVMKFILGLGEILLTRLQIALDHGAHNRLVASDDLAEKGPHYCRLKGRVLVGVIVRTIHEDGFKQLGLGQLSLGGGDLFGGIIGPMGSASQHNVAIGVAAGNDGGGGSIDVDTQECLWLGGSFNGVDRRAQRAIGAVLKPRGMDRPDAIWR